MFDKKKFGSNIACNIAFNFRFDIGFNIWLNQQRLLLSLASAFKIKYYLSNQSRLYLELSSSLTHLQPKLVFILLLDKKEGKNTFHILHITPYLLLRLAPLQWILLRLAKFHKSKLCLCKICQGGSKLLPWELFSVLKHKNAIDCMLLRMESNVFYILSYKVV